MTYHRTQRTPSPRPPYGDVWCAGHRWQAHVSNPPCDIPSGCCFFTGPGQSPALPFACCVGSLRSVGRCGRCSCWCRFRIHGAQSLVCRGCAGCGGMCRLRVSSGQASTRQHNPPPPRPRPHLLHAGQRGGRHHQVVQVQPLEVGDPFIGGFVEVQDGGLGPCRPERACGGGGGGGGCRGGPPAARARRRARQKRGGSGGVAGLLLSRGGGGLDPKLGVPKMA